MTQKKFDVVPNTINKNIGDFHKLDFKDKAFFAISQKAIDALGDRLLIYGELIPIELDIGQYFLYCLNNELDVIDKSKSNLEFNESNGLIIKKLVPTSSKGTTPKKHK